jgi:hypothetical protein
MRRLVEEGSGDPLVRANALKIARSRPDLHPAEAIFYHVRSMPYVRDQDLAKTHGYSSREVSEVLQGANHQVRQELSSGPGSVKGDCDCRSIYVQSALESLGYPTRFAITQGKGSNQYDHVYSEVKVEDGTWCPLDTIMDGKEGRPVFKPGQELKHPEANNKRTFPVKQSIAPLLIGAVIWGLLRK